MPAETAEPYEIRLVVQRTGDVFEARWIESEGQESESFPLSLPLDDSAKKDLRWYLETYIGFVGAGDRVLAAELEQKIEDWGRALYDTLFEHAEGARAHKRLMDAARAHRPAILTVGTDEPDVHVQPWEMIRDRRGPLVFQGVTIRRQLRGAGQARRPQLALPLRVLMITSRPKKAGFIDPRNSIAPMLDALDALPGQVTVDFCEPPTLQRLEKMISEARKRRHPFHIVHFDGHGTFQPETGVGVLAFERDEDGREIHSVTGRSFGDLLSRLEVPLVILEACRSSALSERPIFGSVAPALLQSGVGSVIAFSHSVHIEAARLLVERFYQELAGGRTVGQALEEARSRLRVESKRWLTLGPDPDTVDLQDWFIPQLYQVGPDPTLVSPKSDAATAAAATPRSRTEDLHGFPPPPMYRFHGRAMELLELERAFRRHPALLLTGMGGMGKTALSREGADWWLRTKRFEAAVFHSFEQKAGAERVVQVLGQALEGEEFSSRPAEEQWTTAVALFRERRVLFVWDNFESTLPEFQKGEDDDSPLQFGSEERQRLRKLYRELTEDDPVGRILVTCRPQETELPGIREVPLRGLARPDSLHLLAAVLYQRNISTDRAGYERDAIDALLKAVDDHPLSISLVAPHLKTLTPAQIREELREGPERFADASAEEERNRSLLASLAFSTRRLSEEAHGVLPYLAWFEGGVFEQLLIDFAEFEADAWEAIRGELVATALIRVEDNIRINNRPFLRFHPTLPFTARPYGEPADDVIDVEAVEMRFITVYFSVSEEVRAILEGRQPAVGMALLAFEEANFSSALRRALRRGRRQEGVLISGTLGEYLKRAGRLRERDALVAWVHSQQPEAVGLDGATCAALLGHAGGLLSQGRADEAIAAVQSLIARLEAEGLSGSEDPSFLIAFSYGELGKIYIHTGRPGLALEPTQTAIALYERLTGDEARANLATNLQNLMNAHRALGRFDEALTVAERVLEINRALGRDRENAVFMGQIAEILAAEERYAEADARYAEALRAARGAADLPLQGSLLQHQAILQSQIGNPGRAMELGKEALTLFKQGGDSGSEMRTCNLLGGLEGDLGHLTAAEAWYARGRELAEERNDQAVLGALAFNLGKLHRKRAEQADDPKAGVVYLRRAVSLIEESLAVWLEREDQVHAASSYSELGALHYFFGELDRAEDYLRHSLRIKESLNLPNVYGVYATLAEVARARGDAKAAADWQAKYDAKVAELERLHRGDGTQAGVPPS